MPVSQKLRILALLQSAGEEGISSRWFIQNYLPRAAARVQELKEARWEITSEREGGFCRYTLVGDGGREDGEELGPSEATWPAGETFESALFDDAVSYLPNHSAFTNPDAA